MFVCVCLTQRGTQHHWCGHRAKFTQKCVAWGRGALWPPLTVRVEFQPPPSASPLSPGYSVIYISHRDMHYDPRL